MKHLLMLAVLATLSSTAIAGDTSKHVRAHADKHRAMAEAHRKAAECLDSGKSFNECNVQLEKDCKGLASSGHCGTKM